MDLSRDITSDVASRLRYAYVLITLFFIAVIWRLIVLQLADGTRYRLFAQSHSIRSTRIVAPRGQILDRNGDALVLNRAALDIIVTPQEMGDREQLAQSLAMLSGMPSEIVDKRLASMGAPFQPVALLEDVPYDLAAKVRAWQTPWPDTSDAYDLRGVDVVDRLARTYPDSTIAPHLLGYLREVNQAEIAGSARFVRGDYIGATGIESALDDNLRGSVGYVERLVDARGREVDFPGIQLRQIPPTPGRELILAIDGRLQRVASRLLAGKAGAIVAIDPSTGGVLAMYSSPTYDIGSLEGDKEYWRGLLQNEDHPLLNRAIQSAYPPGSTYKIVTAAGGLSEGVIRSDETINCSGALTVGGHSFGCWRKGGHGAVSLRRALAESCDVYFYTVGLRLGPDRLASYAEKFGLGKKTGIELPYERTGLIPTSEWKLKARNAQWQAGDTLSIAIGQGYDNVTPLQAAVMVATIASGGKRVTPRLVNSSLPPLKLRGGVRGSYGEQVISPEIVSLIRDGLEQVVSSPGGTAHSLSSLGLKIAGKTGTAQVISLLKGKGHGRFADHAWFVAYAPSDAPKIAVAVMLEHGGHGGAAAAPLAGEMIKEYLKK